MAAQVDGLWRHRDDMACAGHDVSVAARAEIGLGGLEGLDHAGFRVSPEVVSGSFWHGYWLI